MTTSALPKESVSSNSLTEIIPEPTRSSPFTGLIAELFDRSERTMRTGVMVTSTHRQAGVSFVCSCIAAELAAKGAKVLLVDAHALLAVRMYPSDLVVSLCRKVGPHELWVLGMEEVDGVVLGTEEICGSAIGTLLHALERKFPYLLIDAPAVSAGPDAHLLATSIYGTVLVTRADQTRDVELKHTHEALTEFGGRVVGTIFNGH